MKEGRVAPIDLGRLNQSFAQVARPRTEASEENPFEEIEVPVDGGMTQSKAGSQLGGIPVLPVNRCLHSEESVRRLG